MERYGAARGRRLREVIPALARTANGSTFWIIDDTGFRKHGKHSVGVARQYCGQLGKTENCQVAVSLSLATTEGSLPLDYRLYLPREWTDDKRRCQRAGVPDDIAFATKGELARARESRPRSPPPSRAGSCSWMPATAMRRPCATG